MPGGHEYLLDPAYAETLAAVVAVGIHSEHLPGHVGIHVFTDKNKSVTRLAAATALGVNAIPDLPHAQLWGPVAAIAQHRHVDIKLYQKEDSAKLRRAHKFSRLGPLEESEHRTRVMVRRHPKIERGKTPEHHGLT